MHVRPEVVDPQGARESRRPTGRQDVIRTGDVVTEGGRRVDEHCAGVTDRRHDVAGVFHQKLEVLGGHQVGDQDRLVQVSDQHGTSTGREGRLDLLGARRHRQVPEHGVEHVVQYGFVPSDDVRRPAGSVFSLCGEIQRHLLRVSRGIGDDDELGRSRGAVDPHHAHARHEPL